MSALRNDATGDADQYERNRELSISRILSLFCSNSPSPTGEGWSEVRGKSGNEA